MPYNDPDPTDPNILVGVELPGDAETMREMAYVYAEEFVRMGYNGAQVLTLFKTPFYAGAHRAYRALGETETQFIIDECAGAWGRSRITVQEVQVVRPPPSSSPASRGRKEVGA